MKLKLLRKTHCDYNADQLQRNSDLFKGGDEFKKRVARYLIKNQQEPIEVFRQRCEAAHYVNYCGPVGNYFASWLFTAALEYRTEPKEVDDFYAEFREDADGKGTDWDHWLRHRFIECLINQCTFWRIEMPTTPPDGADPDSLAEWKRQGRGRATVVPMPAETITNWKKKPDGKSYEWIVEHTKVEQFEEFGDEIETVTETWTKYSADEPARRWQAVYLKTQPPGPDDDIAEIDGPEETVDDVICMHVPSELYVMGLIGSAQLESFRKRCALSWSIDRTCYAMPCFHLKDKRHPPKMGAGYYLMIGEKEQVTYPAPTAAPYDTIKSYASEVKDEIHRVAQQMARGVENNAAAIGRSGESKQADDVATEIVLSAYGKHVRDPVERTMDRIAKRRGEQIEWTVTGMSSYHVVDMATMTEMVMTSETIPIPSKTRKQELYKRLTWTQMPDLDDAKKDAISKEIEAGVTDETMQAQTAPPPPPGAPGAPKATDDANNMDDGAAGTEAVDAVYHQLADDFEENAIAWIKKAQWDGPVDVALDEIDFDGKSAWRAAGHKAKVAKFAKKIGAGDKKPIILVKPPKGGKYKVADGHHRALAYLQLKQPPRAYVATVDEEGFSAAMQMHAAQKHLS